MNSISLVKNINDIEVINFRLAFSARHIEIHALGTLAICSIGGFSGIRQAIQLQRATGGRLSLQ